MTKRFTRAFLAMGALATACASWGCVADRPSRNGVFNENQYVRKAFLVRPDANTPDNGWFLKATIIHTSAPNPLASFNLFNGAENNGSYVRFAVTSDSLEMINLRELSPGYPNQATREPEILNSWPITNVDLKYKINLDGEKTNFYEENQELDWQTRQWIKINFGKNNMSDLAPLGSYAQSVLSACTDTGNAFSTLVPGSFKVDEPNNYMQFAVSLTLPVKFDSAACTTGFGAAGTLFQKFGRSSINLTLQYSLVRATTPAANDPLAYEPLEIEEKDPIRRKYGTIDIVPVNRDPDSGLLGARALAMRFNPKRPLVYYFAPGYPKEFKGMFTDPGGIVDQTNKLFADANAPIRLTVKEFDADLAPGEPPRDFGDIRYNFIRWEQDIDTGSGFIGVTQFVPDPRTGELISSSINIADFQLQDRVTARLDFYLETIGAKEALDMNGEWPVGAACNDGDVMPLVPETVKAIHNGKSTLFAKMQEYLQKPVAQFGNLGPADFTVKQDADFFHAYFALLPYQLYADPLTNQFVTPEGGSAAFGPSAQLAALAKDAEFHAMTAQLEKGQASYDADTGPASVAAAAGFLDKMHDLTIAHNDYTYMKNFNHGTAMFDDAGLISLQNVFERDARHCVNGHFETRKEYIDNLVYSYHALTVWHEFGHAIGLDHNFMASVDRPNYPHYKDGQGRDHIGMYQSSVMEYNATPDRVFWRGSTGRQGWGPYDQGAISFIYGNTKKDTSGMRGPGVSGQSSKTAPWNDPNGFMPDGQTEIQYLFCNANHMKYSPFCRQFDFGSTPSEIIASQIDDYEWNFKWRNFRLYRKFWDLTAYGDAPAALMQDLRRFLSAWQFDWTSSEISDTLRRIGIAPPPGAPNQAAYYSQLTNKFNQDMSAANQMVAAFHKAIVQQGSGERPYLTVYDNFFGDVTQQGIATDKFLAVQSWTDIWPVTNYDPNQAQGAYMASYSGSFGDPSYQTVAEDAVESMIGGQYDIFPFFKPLAVTQFAKATHDTRFNGRIEVRDWVGGKVFYRQQDFLDFFRGLAVKYNTINTPGCLDDLHACKYDPTTKRDGAADIRHSDDYNEFVGPDNRRWIWAYVQDRNVWVAVDRDRNTASYIIVRAYTADVIHGEDDGNVGNAYGKLLPIKYFLDSFNQYN